MSFEVDRYSSAWAHIALCADLTWASEPPDEFIVANQRLWAQHCRVSQVLQETTIESSQCVSNHCDHSDQHLVQNQENGSCSGRRSVKDVIPESRLAQFYGNFYYDDIRENSYTCTNEKANARGYNGHGCDNTDLTECWMLPEVEYWFRKLMDESTDRSMLPRRRRQYKILPDEDFRLLRHPREEMEWLHSPLLEPHGMHNTTTRQLVPTRPLLTQEKTLAKDILVQRSECNMEINEYQSAASERWGPTETRAAEEATLEARIRGTRSLWNQTPPQRRPARVPSPPPASRKMRARRRQPRRLTLAPPPPAYCLDAPTQLFCDPSCKFQFDAPRPQLTEYQRAMGRLSASVQAVMRANACRCPPYRGTNISRYAPTGPRPLRYPDRRYGIWWPRENLSPRLENKFNITQLQNINSTQKSEKSIPTVETEIKKENQTKEEPENTSNDEHQTDNLEEPNDTPENPPQQKEKIVVDNQLPSTSAAAIEGARKKRLYSTVLSMSPPPPINLNAIGCLRLSQKLAPGLIKLNSKIVLPSRIRPNVDNKFEELEKEALEQYKASDESIDTKFRELEEEAVDQYSTSNSNTSCSSGNSGEKKAANISPDNEIKTQSSKFHKEKSVDSVVIYSQNFPDLNTKGNTNSATNLKNFHTPPRGEKKEHTHRSSKCARNNKIESQRPASDTDYEARESNNKGTHKGAMRWTLHVMPPKKRHLTSCVSDFSSDEELEDASVSIRDAGACIKNRATGKIKMSAHGGGDLHPIMRKT